MIYGCFVWIMTMPYYRALGDRRGGRWCSSSRPWAGRPSARPTRGAGWSRSRSWPSGLKLAHWGYYAPEWNYRLSQGPWGRAIGQWLPRKWPLYTVHDWPPDLAFFIGRPVRQLPSPRFLELRPRPRMPLRPAPGVRVRQLARPGPAPHPGRPRSRTSPARNASSPGPRDTSPSPARTPAGHPEPGRRARRPPSRRNDRPARHPSTPDRTIVRSDAIMHSDFSSESGSRTSHKSRIVG